MLRFLRARDLLISFKDLKYLSELLSLGGITISPIIFRSISRGAGARQTGSRMIIPMSQTMPKAWKSDAVRDQQVR